MRSVDRTIVHKDGKKYALKGRLLKPNTGTNGYLYIIASKNGNRHCLYLHRLVAETFISTENPNLVVDHINECKTDNRVENLRWLDERTNVLRSAYRRRDYDKHFEHNPRARKVYEYDNDGHLCNVWKCAKYIAIEYGVIYSTLKRQLQRDRCFINNNRFSYANNK